MARALESGLLVCLLSSRYQGLTAAFFLERGCQAWGRGSPSSWLLWEEPCWDLPGNWDVMSSSSGSEPLASVVVQVLIYQPGSRDS